MAEYEKCKKLLPLIKEALKEIFPNVIVNVEDNFCLEDGNSGYTIVVDLPTETFASKNRFKAYKQFYHNTINKFFKELDETV